MIYVRDPDEGELLELKRMTRQEVGRISQRAQMVLLSTQGYTVGGLATLFEQHPVTVRSWLRRFTQDGPTGLYDAPRSGRPRHLDPADEQFLHTLLESDPHTSSLAAIATTWTIAMLTWVLTLRVGHYLSRSTVRAVVRRIGARFTRPRLAMPRKVDPAKAAKQLAITEAVIAAGPQATVLYADESRIQTLPLLRAMWQWAGQQRRIPTPGTNQTRSLFGALNIRSGQWSYLVRERIYAADFIVFLEHLLTVYPQGTILLVVDNFSSHHAKTVKEWLQEHARLRVHYLPTYCSHLNPVEPIWRRLKDAVAANRLHASMTALLHTVDCFFTSMSPEQARIWAGLER